ncbi:unnamed protein product [Acanthoscelides obtectus]|uniref:Uncharacterized protein n=1 Tax=Acanthoscelides obtectus TaxID=200917 RepID=A0A9P0VS09_ACAOB|nr:unnamed protein product [Acanthoscelides obtectus]CAK1626652.1 hypothetical protein AOBTE_LOCUS4006 [Acanthoscelides obtectus]
MGRQLCCFCCYKQIWCYACDKRQTIFAEGKEAHTKKIEQISNPSNKP